jgi:hypothetical protein
MTPQENGLEMLCENLKSGIRIIVPAWGLVGRSVKVGLSHIEQ